MSDNPQILSDLIKIVDANNAERDVSDLLNEAPLLSVLFADVASNGTTHKYLKETGAPVVGFRAVNVGRDTSKSADTQVSIDLKILAANFWVDKALADANPKGAAAHLAREGNRHLRAAFFAAEQQYIYGTGQINDGFAGLLDSLALGNGMVVDAAGTTATTGSSVFAIRSTPDLNDVVAIAGNDGQIGISETVVIEKVDSNSKGFPAYYTPVEGWMALQIGGAHSVGRIANVTDDSTHTLTDTMIAELLSRFPAGRQPTHLVMNRRSRMQLQKSRTATNATGAPAPFPTEAFGVPILTTDSIVSTEAIEQIGT